MTLAPVTRSPRERLLDQQHIVLDNVSWSFYGRVLEELGNRPIRVTYSHGKIEIMPPLPEHELPKKSIGRLIEALAIELRIPMTAYGSTTFRRRDKQTGLEPDECYYLHNAPRVRGMKRFDPAIHPPPDLAVEIDITSRSIPRQPIYAALGVPELWRFDGRLIQVLRLGAEGHYVPISRSGLFPFLPIETLSRFVYRMMEEEQTAVVVEFQEWVRALPKT